MIFGEIRFLSLLGAVGSSGFPCGLGSFGQCPVQGWLCRVHREHQGAETRAAVPGCVRWQCSSSPDPAPGRAPRSPVEKEHVTLRTLHPGTRLVKWGTETPRPYGKARAHPSTVQPGSSCTASSRHCSPAWLANSSAHAGKGRGKSADSPSESASTGLNSHREPSRRSVLSCTGSLNSVTLSFGPTHKHNSQISHTLPQGSKHYLDKWMVWKPQSYRNHDKNPSLILHSIQQPPAISHISSTKDKTHVRNISAGTGSTSLQQKHSPGPRQQPGTQRVTRMEQGSTWGHGSSRGTIPPHAQW